MLARTLFLLGIALLPALPATRLLVTVVEAKTGRAVADLKASDLTVMDDKTPRAVEAVESATGLVDIMLLLDTSLVGEMVRPLAGNLIAQLQPKEQMAVVSFHSSADLIQDFTASKELLKRAVADVKYGNTPRVLDALYAAMDGGFESSGFRRVILLLTTGYEGPSRVTEKDAIRLARKNGVSIFPIYVVGSEKWLFENLARQTGGASFRVGDMRKSGTPEPGAAIFDAVRRHYIVTIQGSLSPSDKLKVTVNRPEKLNASALPLE
jgi:VWFA-related protein